MRATLYGLFDESYVVRTGADRLDVAAEAHELRDRELVRLVLAQLAAEPINQAAFRALVADQRINGSHWRPTWEVEAGVVSALAARIVEGAIHFEVPARFRVRVPVNLHHADPTEPPDVLGGAPDEDKILPCDFATVVIKCKHMPDAAEEAGKRTMSDARFWRAAGNDLDNLAPPAASRAYTKVIEVIGSHVDRGADDISIVLEGGPGYTCGSSHPKIRIQDSAGWKQEHQGETSVTFKAKCRELPPPTHLYGNPLELIRYYFFPDQTTNNYTIDVESCGRLADGSYGFGRSQQRVRVYPSDSYKLTFSVPPFKKKSYERSRHTRPDGTLVSKEEHVRESLIAGERETSGRTEKVGPRGYESEDSYKFETRQGGLEETTTTVTGSGRTTELKDTLHPIAGPLGQLAPGFSVTRNGADIEGTHALGAFIDAMIRIERTIQEIMNFIREFQPQVGWKFVFEIELFKGELSYEWGYKEWQDHTVFEWWKFAVGMTLFALKLELSFGAEFKVCGFGVTACLFGNVSVEAGVEASVEGTPAADPWKLAVTGTPKGEIGIRSVLGADWVKAEGKLTVGLEFAAECECSTSQPFHIDWKLDFKGVKAVVLGSVRWVGAFQREWTVIEPKRNWQRGRFPALAS